jgi:hypothetical protein
MERAYSRRISMIMKDLVLLAVPDPSRSWKAARWSRIPPDKPLPEMPL